MSKLPSMPFFVDAYLGDTTHLTCEEHGFYILLLFAMWRRGGSIPDNDQDNARICKVTLRRFYKLKRRIMPFLTSYGSGTDACLTQKRLQKEWNYTIELSRVQRTKGVRSGEVRSERNQILRSNRGSSPVRTEWPTEWQPDGQPNGNRTRTPRPNKDITTISTVSAREEGKEETIPESQPPPDGARATDGPAPPALNGKAASPSDGFDLSKLPEHLRTNLIKRAG